MLGLSFGHILHECICKQALTDVRLTGAGIKCLYCSLVPEISRGIADIFSAIRGLHCTYRFAPNTILQYSLPILSEWPIPNPQPNSRTKSRLRDFPQDTQSPYLLQVLSTLHCGVDIKHLHPQPKSREHEISYETFYSHVVSG